MVMNLYRNIDRNRIQFDFVIDHPTHLYFADEIKTLGGKIYVLPRFKGTNILEIRKAWNRFFAENKEYKILHSHVRSYASLYIPIAKKNGLKTIIHSHSISNGKGISSVIKAILQYPLRYQADYFFACSLDAGRWLFGEKVISSDRFQVIKNAIDLSKYRYEQKNRVAVRRALGLNEENIVYISVGRLHESKNYFFLIDLFSEIHKKNNNSRLVIVGDGELEKEIRMKIDQYGIADSVHMLGARKDVNILLQCADVFLFPSKWEGLGISAIEAQAVGITCICSPSIPKETIISQNCVQLNTFKLKEWIECIGNLCIKKSDNIESLKDAGYDIKQTAQWIEKKYENILHEE